MPIGKGVSLSYRAEWLASGFALKEDLPLIDTEFLPPGRLVTDAQHASLTPSASDLVPFRTAEAGHPRHLTAYLREYEPVWRLQA